MEDRIATEDLWRWVRNMRGTCVIVGPRENGDWEVTLSIGRRSATEIGQPFADVAGRALDIMGGKRTELEQLA